MVPQQEEPSGSGPGEGPGRSRLEQMVEDYLRRLPGHVSDLLGTHLRLQIEAAQQRTDNALDQLRSSVGSIEERLSSALSSVTEATQVFLSGSVEAYASSLRRISERLESVPDQDDMDTVREAVKEAIGEVRSDLGTFRQAPQRIAETVKAISEALGSIVEAQAGVEEKLQEVSDSVKPDFDSLNTLIDDTIDGLKTRISETANQLRWEVGQGVGPLHEGFELVRQTLAQQHEALRAGIGRIEYLVGAMERLDRRHGFRELVRSEEQLRKDQEQWVERLGGLETKVGEFGVELRQKLDQSISGSKEVRGKLVQEVNQITNDQLTGALGEFRTQMDDLFSHKAVTSAFREVVRTQRALGKAAADLRQDVGDLRAQIEGWGKPRSAARLSKEVKDLDDRVVQAEEAVTGKLVDVVMQRLKGLFDRRFDAVVQLVEVRLQQMQTLLEQQPEPSRRGLFGRSRASEPPATD